MKKKKQNKKINPVFILLMFSFICGFAGMGYWYMWVHGDFGMFLSFSFAGLLGLGIAMGIRKKNEKKVHKV